MKKIFVFCFLCIWQIALAGTVFTAQGVVQRTNLQRQQNGDLPALKESAVLNRVALRKVTDMFQQHYFSHYNPQNIGPGKLATTSGYEFIYIGENLALLYGQQGYPDLFAAWMKSPGHRANILNPNYKEMGAAAMQGFYQGHKTWFIVQEFGCPK